jgi:hypothetical protein
MECDTGCSQKDGQQGRSELSLLGVGGMIPTTRIFPILRFFFNGSLVDPRFWASNDINAPSKLAHFLFRDGG